MTQIDEKALPMEIKLTTGRTVTGENIFRLARVAIRECAVINQQTKQ